jgi:hypothetical protein
MRLEKLNTKQYWAIRIQQVWYHSHTMHDTESFLESSQNNLLDIGVDPHPHGTHSFCHGGCQLLPWFSAGHFTTFAHGEDGLRTLTTQAQFLNIYCPGLIAHLSSVRITSTPIGLDVGKPTGMITRTHTCTRKLPIPLHPRVLRGVGHCKSHIRVAGTTGTSATRASNQCKCI